MSIDNNTCVTSYTVTDPTTRTYDLGFTMREECTVAITIKRNGVLTVIDADYYTLDEDQTAVTLLSKADIQEGDTLIISRVTPDTQQVTLTEGDKLPAKTIEHALDRATMRCAELAKQIEDARQELADMQALIDEATNSGGITPTTATATRLGMVKVGNNLSVTDDGTLSTSLPVATETTLGGIKVGYSAYGLWMDNGVLRVKNFYNPTYVDAGSVLISNKTAMTRQVGEWVNLARYCSLAVYGGSNVLITISPSVLQYGYEFTAAATITLNTNIYSWGYLSFILKITAGSTVVAGDNLTIVDPITPGKANHCMALWYNRHAYLYVFAVTDL